jgi:hypothetical protein
MIRYAAERYGSDHVAQIVTFSTIKARAAVRDAARVLGYPPQLGDKIAKAMPPLVMGQDLPLEACFTRRPATRAASSKRRRAAHALRQRRRGQALDRRRQGLRRQAAPGRHPRRRGRDHQGAAPRVRAGAAQVPRTGRSEDAPIVTQYEATAIEKLGLLKMDFLGLRNLAIIERTLENIRRRTASRSTSTRRARRPQGLRDAAPRQLDRHLPARGRQDAPTHAPPRADQLRRHRGPQRAVPTRSAGGERAQRLRRPQERSPARQLRPPRPRGDPRRDLRADDLPRGHHARGDQDRRLLDDRGRRPAQGLLEEDPRDDSRPSARSSSTAPNARATVENLGETIFNKIEPFADYAFPRATPTATDCSATRTRG